MLMDIIRPAFVFQILQAAAYFRLKRLRGSQTDGFFLILDSQFII